MSNLFSQGTIKSRVMKQINARIDAIEQEYEEGCDEIDRKAEQEKATLADKHVESIIGKIL